MKNFAAALLGAASMLAASIAAHAQDHPLPSGHGFPGGKPIDILGFYPGMSGKDAQPLIATHYGKQQRKPFIQMAKMPFANDAFLRLASYNAVAGRVNFDDVVLFFSGSGSGNQAVFVRRIAQFVGPSRPNREAMLSAIRDKFGEPSFIVNQSQYYYFKDGRRLTQQDGRDFDTCRGMEQSVISVGGRQGSPQDERSLIGYFAGAHNSARSFKGWCDMYVRVTLQTGSDEVAGQVVANPNVISFLDMLVFDHARFVATSKADSAAMEALQNKAKQSVPAGTAAPRL